MEGIAQAGEVVVSRSTAALLAADTVGTAEFPQGFFWPSRSLRVEARRRFPRCGSSIWRSASRREFASTTSRAAADLEHRPIATAFVEFQGADALLERRGPDALAGAIEQLVLTVQEAAHRHQVVDSETDIAADGARSY